MILDNWLAQRAQTCPDRTALVAEGRSLTYEELEAEAVAGARRLAAHGVRRGATVTLELPAGADYVVLLHSLMKLGAIAQPLNTRLAPAERGRADTVTSEARHARRSEAASLVLVRLADAVDHKHRHRLASRLQLQPRLPLERLERAGEIDDQAALLSTLTTRLGYVLTGSMRRDGRRVSVDARLLYRRTGLMVGQWRLTTHEDSLPRVADAIAVGVLAALNAEHTSGCSWIALPSISLGWKAWIDKRR